MYIYYIYMAQTLIHTIGVYGDPVSQKRLVDKIIATESFSTFFVNGF